jgi:hypothetical protein
MTPRITTLADVKTNGGYTIGERSGARGACSPRGRVDRLLAQINRTLACLVK